MKGIRILIDTRNAAFAEYPEMELARIFRVLSDQLEHGEIPETLIDSNGNTVGELWTLETDIEVEHGDRTEGDMMMDKDSILFDPATVESDSLENYETAFPRPTMVSG